LGSSRLVGGAQPRLQNRGSRIAETTVNFTESEEAKGPQKTAEAGRFRHSPKGPTTVPEYIEGEDSDIPNGTASFL